MNKKHSRREFLLSAIFMVLLTLLAGGMGVYVLSEPALKVAFRFVNAAAALESQYPGQLDWNALFDDAMSGMIARLDRYSGYVQPERFSRMDEEKDGSYGGIGITIVDHEHGLLVMSVRENGPAAEQGILSGDIIIKADGTVLSSLNATEATRLLRGPDGSKVELTLFRPVTKDTSQVTLVRRQIQLQHIPFAGFMPDSLIYIRLIDFDPGTAKDLEAAVDSLVSKSPQRARGLILDLRGNPGGLLHEAFFAADIFLKEGQLIVGTDGRSRWNSKKLFASGEDKADGVPMAVIVDRGTASAAEILAGALRQNNRAVLVGDTTFGKGLVQGFNRFDDGSGLRLTISRYYLEGNVYFNEFDSMLHDSGIGLPPDHVIRFVEREHFPRALEASLLLPAFSIDNQNEILAAYPYALSDDWMVRFQEFVQSRQFKYRSARLQHAETIFEAGHLEGASPQVLAAAKKLVELAKESDRDVYVQYADYIRMRLAELAHERKFGTHKTYAEVIVRQKPEILEAAALLRALSSQ